MKRPFPVGLAIGVFIVVAIIVSIKLVPPIDWKRLTSAERVQTAPSDIYASLDVRYDEAPVFEETYAMEDKNGASSFEYTIVRANGPSQRVKETIKVPPMATYDVSFFFGQLVNDGVWELPSQPPRGDTSAHYTLTVRQTEDYKSGKHVATFTDPHYWAAVAGREFHIHLSPKGPLPNLLQLQGEGVRDPRYQQIVNDFRKFGPAAFRAAIARARSHAHA